MSWDKISLQVFQEIESINSNTALDSYGKVVLSACIIYDITPVDFENNLNAYSKRIEKIFKEELKPGPMDKIGKYKINYDCGQMRFGQFIEANYYLSQNHVKNAEKVLASISNEPVRKTWWKKPEWINDSEKHSERSLFFLQQPVTKVMGCISKFIESFSAFQKSYNWLFGLDEKTHGETAQVDKFNKVYGWWYAAESIATYKRIMLDEVYGLNVRDAFSSLAYLKAKSKYETEQFNKK